MKIYEIYEDDYKYYIVIELMQGKSLYEYIADIPKSSLTEAKVADFMKQVLSGLNCCHVQGIAHRDIKPENLMFVDPECAALKLIDFGFAKFFKEGQCKFKEILGSPMYMAPEIITQQKYNEKCDLWSSGILCYTLLSGEMAYTTSDDDPVEVLFDHIKAKVFTKEDLKSGVWAHISNEAKDFVLCLLQKNPEKRPTAKDMLSHPWLSMAKDEHSDAIEARKAMERLLNINVYSISLHNIGQAFVPTRGSNFHSILLRYIRRKEETYKDISGNRQG